MARDLSKMILLVCVALLFGLCIMGPGMVQKRTDDSMPGGNTTTSGKAVATVEAVVAPVLATVEAFEDNVDEAYAETELEFCLTCCDVSPLLDAEGVVGCQAVCYNRYNR